MDPDEALKQLRILAAAVQIAKDNNTLEAEDAGLMADLFEGLDGWISRGGFLPAAWVQKPSSQGTRA